jgi:hypothetical protein
LTVTLSQVIRLWSIGVAVTMTVVTAGCSGSAPSKVAGIPAASRAAADTKANDCTATALAYAARTYETAHNNPDGPKPEINAQACDADYAEIVFTQTTPPHGYTAAYAFKASPSGWQEIGSADYIAPGEFGMPVNVSKDINRSLSSAPRTEHVPF